MHPLKFKKMNIGIEDRTKLASIGDYWDDQTTQEIFDLLKEYEDLFRYSISELKEIEGKLGEMKITLKLDAKLIKN